MKKRFVAIGASAASIAFITKLRTFDKESEIICISGEKEIPYNRCFLADYLSQNIGWDHLQLKPDGFFEAQDIRLELATWVSKIDVIQNRVSVQDRHIPYDYLFLGMGSKPFVPSIGVNDQLRGVFTFHTADDIKKLYAFIHNVKNKKVIVVGAGLNGLECAGSLNDLGFSVTVIERNDHILSAQVDQECADYIHNIILEKGVEILCQAAVVEVLSHENMVTGLLLHNGQFIEGGAVVFATGSMLHNELLKETNIVTQQGSVVVDHGMRTNIANIYAGGDICLVKDVVSGRMVKSATWADAMLQGLCAATQFSDKPRQYPGYVGLRDSVLFGVDFYACGYTFDHRSNVQLIKKIFSNGIHVFYVENDILIGFVLFADVSKVALYKQWYMTQRAVAETDFL